LDPRSGLPLRDLTSPTSALTRRPAVPPAEVRVAPDGTEGSVVERRWRCSLMDR
jgi:hypothetical protein